jgi:hypothetical protein
MKRALCESAKHGRLCCDDLCHNGGETLCGFDPVEYEEMTREVVGDIYDCGDPETHDAMENCLHISVSGGVCSICWENLCL